MNIDFTQFDSLFSVMEYFTTDQICKQTIAQSRWSDGDVVAPTAVDIIAISARITATFASTATISST